MKTRRHKGWLGLIGFSAALRVWFAALALPGHEAGVVHAEDSVRVEASGSRYDPPVKASQIPAGSWMCEMGGKVHYASGTHGDGKCPVCGMKLVRKAEAAKPDHSTHNHPKH